MWWDLFGNDELDDYNAWLVTAVPPNSYAIEIGYLDPAVERIKPSDSDSYPLESISWIDLPMRFPNYAQANIYATKKYTPILYRIVGSNFKTNYFKYDDYQIHKSKTNKKNVSTKISK